tara:strand:+ start:184 stop:759 length:576 start_codon:yes stop_codon:yes gene_type:complete
MKDKKIVKISIIFLSLAIITTLTYYIFFNEEKIAELEPTKKEEPTYSSNIIKDVEYITTDADGNEYIITSIQGEIDFNFPNIIYLTKVKALIKLKDSNKIIITSDYGKYNTDNFDTIFSKNVLINYLDNKITGEYLDFSFDRNTLIISKKVIYTNLENVMHADVIEMNIKTKDTKIFMYEDKKKVNIKSKN